MAEYTVITAPNRKLDGLLVDLGIFSLYLGRRFLREAVYAVCWEGFRPVSNRAIYREIAKRFGTEPRIVEHGFRFLPLTAFEKNPQLLARVLEEPRMTKPPKILIMVRGMAEWLTARDLVQVTDEKFSLPRHEWVRIYDEEEGA